MDFSKMQDYQYFLNLGWVSVAASLLTLLFTFLAKLAMRKKGFIYEGMDAVRKDRILSETARWVAFACYLSLYVGSQFIDGKQISFDGSFLVGVVSGTVLTLAVSKAVYTALHQIDLRFEKSKEESSRERKASEKKAPKIEEGKDDEGKTPVDEKNKATSADTGKTTRSWTLHSK